MTAVGQKRKQTAAAGTPSAGENPLAGKPARRGKSVPRSEAAPSESQNSSAECVRLANQVSQVLRRFHKDVGSPLAATGLMLELVQSEPKLSKESQMRLAQAVRDLDRVITTVRISIEQLRGVECTLREHIR